jgi:hypothetical protein
MEESSKIGDSKNIIKSEEKIENKNEKKAEEKKFFNDIVCPICQTSAIIENDDLQLKIINCDNFHHISNIKYDKFEDLEEKLFDITPENQKKFRCELCSTNILEMTPPDDKLYICTCGSKLCGVCFKTHNDSNHYKCEIENKNYKCLLHDKGFISYCDDCNMNICESCHTHQDHEIFKFSYLIPKDDYIEKITEEVENQKKILSSFVENSKKLFTF